MSGHSKWHNIRIRKQRQDQAKGKLFSKLTRELLVAVRQAGSNPETNSLLRLAIERAKDLGLPMENIKRAIARASGSDSEDIHYEEARYEGYGQGGVAILIDVLTDNKNRTVNDLRRLFNRYGGSLGEAGCVAWQFEKKGLLMIDIGQVDEETLLAWALEAGAEDAKVSGNSYEILTSPENFSEIKSYLQGKNLQISLSEITMIPNTTVKLAGKEAQQLLKLLSELEEHDDVQRVYANFDIPDELIEQEAAA